MTDQSYTADLSDVVRLVARLSSFAGRRPVGLRRGTPPCPNPVGRTSPRCVVLRPKTSSSVRRSTRVEGTSRRTGGAALRLGPHSIAEVMGEFRPFVDRSACYAVRRVLRFDSFHHQRADNREDEKTCLFSDGSEDVNKLRRLNKRTLGQTAV